MAAQAGQAQKADDEASRKRQRQRDARLAKLWANLDYEREGSVNLDQLKKGFKRLEHPLRDAHHLMEDILAVVDTSGDGRIQYEEFKRFFEATDRELWRIFDAVDVDQDGKIDKRELRRALFKSGINVNGDRLEQFFKSMDQNRDGVISYDEWRDFLIFMPHRDQNLRTIYSYYLSTVNVNPEGDVVLSDEINLRGLGYFFAGAVAGVVSRTATAPFDRLKVYLIARTHGSTPKIHPIDAMRSGKPIAQEASKLAGPLKDALRDLWRQGGVRSFFAGNGLNVVKVLPESGIKFGSFEAAKRMLARFEGVEVADISPVSRFLAGGIGGVCAQFAIYPLDTLKFRVQCESVEGGLRGNALIRQTIVHMWKSSGVPGFYRGLPMGVLGIFPYSAIDLGTFEYMKKKYIRTRAAKENCDESNIDVPNTVVLAIGATSGSVGAAAVYPINVLRTRLQAQGTTHHPQRYTGMWDVLTKTLQQEGPKGLYRGLTPNLAKVIPAVSISYLVYENSKELMGLK
ncbi:mitochondrial carrier [Ascobolus immersus RN42]|uniref:Mitochondrial thiamine pyrophosphate carrier 1 n=1 Tax=Ascobolus immersus RN42 TaxID=1160509 RepID=A0A3N4IUL4_ASCIM|nr:mitochondrial carrier [Ascobolus immersus RN42]